MMHLTPQQSAKVQRAHAAARILLDCHEGQRRMLRALDRSRYIAGLYARRQGKSEGWLRHMVAMSLMHGGKRWVFADETHTAAFQTVLPIVEGLGGQYGFEVRANRKTHEIDIGGRGRIWCLGYRQPAFMQVLRGKWFDGALIDEAQKAADVDLAGMINRIVVHCLADKGGWLVLVGTAGDVARGLFYQAAKRAGLIVSANEIETEASILADELRLSSMFRVIAGRPFENPHMERQQRSLLEEYRRTDPDIESRPWVRRELFGEWVSDASAAPIPVADANLIATYEVKPSDRIICGVDYGFNPDPTAWVVATCAPERHSKLVILESHEQARMEDADIIERARLYRERYPSVEFVVDYGGGGSRHCIKVLRDAGFAASACDKTIDERSTLNEIRDDACAGRVLFYNVEDPERPNAHPMVMYLRSARWVMTKDGLMVGKPKHRMDALRYLYRKSAHRSHVPQQAAPSPEDALLNSLRDEEQTPYWG